MVGDLDPGPVAPSSVGQQKLAPEGGEPARGFKPCWVSLQLKGECPIGWWGHTVNYTDGKLYVSGGYGKQRSAEIYCVSPTTWECKKLVTSGAVPGPRDSHTCATVGKDLILVGGTDGKSKKSEVYLFNTETLEWKLIQALGEPPTPREGHTACVIDSKLVIFGGMGEEPAPDPGCSARAVYLGDIVFLDLKTYTWQRTDVNEGPAPRDSHAAAAAGNRLVVFGGDRGDQYLDDVWIFTMDTMRWTQAELTSSVAPGPRAGHISVSVGPNSILVFGGVGPDQENNNDSWILHIGPDESHGLAAGQACWEVLEVTGNHLPQGRFAHAADVEDGCLYVIGGCTATAQPMCDFHVLCLTEEAAARMPAGSTKASRRDSDGQPKKVTSYNLFCSHHRVGLRDENPGLSAREVERLMGQKWSQLSADEKKPYEDEAYRIYATNMASFKASQGVGGAPVDLSDSAAKREHSGLEPTFAKRQKMDPSQVQALQQPTQVCQIYSPNPSLLGAQVEGHVDGAFNSGYLATVRVNGFTYRALLFSPYLALPTPGIAALGPVAHVAHDTSGIPPDQLGHGPPSVPEPNTLVPSTAPLSVTSAAPLLPSSHLNLPPSALMLQSHPGAQPAVLSSTVGMPSQFQMSAPAAVANGAVQPLDAVHVMNGG